MLFPVLSGISDQFITTDFDTTMILKACGFIDEHNAEIIDVDRNYLKLRIGSPWIERLISLGTSPGRVEVTLQIGEIAREEQQYEERLQRLPAADCSQVNVTITPTSRNWKETEFKQFARKLMWSLRSHFLAPA